MTKSRTTWPRPAPDNTPAPIEGARNSRSAALRIEVIDKGTGCPACQYMHETVTLVLAEISHLIDYRRINLRTSRGRKRFLTLCEGIYGHDQVHRHLRLAPVPSLFMDGQLIFSTIPDMDRLQAAIAQRLP